MHTRAHLVLNGAPTCLYMFVCEQKISGKTVNKPLMVDTAGGGFRALYLLYKLSC